MSGAFAHIDEGLPAPDRRSHSRQPVRTLAYVELDEGNGGIVLNASEGGLSVQAVMSLMEESLPKMRFQLSQSKEWLETSARVAWASESRKVAGLQFVDLPEEARLHIQAWLTAGASEAEPGEPQERAAAYNHAHDQVDSKIAGQIDYQTPGEPRDLVREAGSIGMGRDTIGSTKTAPPVESVSTPASASPAAPTSQLFGEMPAFEATAQPTKSISPEAKRPDHAWNIAGLVALLATLSLVAGWIAGRGMFDRLWDKPQGTAFSTQTAQSGLARVSASASPPVSNLEIVDIHNQRWTIPFSPTASTNQTNSRSQAAPVEWPTFNPSAAVPDIQAPGAGNDGSQQPSPPEVAASSNSASTPIPSASPDPHDLVPPAPKPEPQAARPVGVLQRGVLIYHVNPEYPEIAREQNVQGTVKLQVTIGVTGAVRSVVAISGPGLLIEAARSAVRQWRYTPSLLDGKPFELQEEVSVVFQLQPTSR
jgi:TonB family protein